MMIVQRTLPSVALLLLSTDALAAPTPWYADADADGYGSELVRVSEAGPAGATAARGDCDDSDSGVHPRAVEICDGLDNDCTDGPDDHGVCRWSGTITTGASWSTGTAVTSLGAVDLDDDGEDEAVIVGLSRYWVHRGAAWRLDAAGLSALVLGESRGDALGYLPAITVGGLLLITSVNADYSGIDSGALYTVLGGTLGSPVYGSGASGSTSDYNGTLADAGSGSVLAGFPSAGGADDGAAFVVGLDATLIGGQVDTLADLSLWPESTGEKLGRRVGAIDLDGDHVSELLVADSAVIHVVPGGLSGSATITDVELGQLSYTDVDWIGAADADGDRTLDLAILTDGTLVVLDRADAVAGYETAFATRAEVQSAAFGDLDGDSLDDLVWAGADGSLLLAYGPFDGEISADATGDATGVEHIALADIDRDGILDVVYSTSADVLGVHFGE